MNILLSPHEEEVHSSSFGYRSTHSAVYSPKRFKHFSTLIYYCAKVIVNCKNTNKEFNCAMVLIIRPCSTLKFQFSFFLLNVSMQFFPYYISGFIFRFACITFDFTKEIALSHLSSIPINKKLECKDNQIYSKMLKEICKTEV